jgi:hypothetical protein
MFGIWTAQSRVIVEIIKITERRSSELKQTLESDRSVERKGEVSTLKFTRDPTQ